ncbi:hypothetical protein [Halobacterium yunchengense]|uniref:hypothetical protein n=1 Tax=Halobacterium yunchengense TaxID=3108497 RepID=UPI00300BE39D
MAARRDGLAEWERGFALAGVVLVGLALAAVHWLGLLVGGAGVGLLARSWPRALAGGAGFGALAWLAFVAVLADAGRLAGYLASGQLLALSAGMAVGLGLVGGLAYGLRSAGSTA